MNHKYNLYNKYANHPKNIRYHALCWGDSEIALRHPDLPLGTIFRDNGQTDIYAGKSRLIMTIDGITLARALSYGIVSDSISLVCRGIENFRINQKCINKDVFNGKKVAVAKVDEKTLTASCFVLSSAGAPVPITEFFELKPIFETPPEPESHASEVFRKIRAYIKGDSNGGCFGI